MGEAAEALPSQQRTPTQSFRKSTWRCNSATGSRCHIRVFIVNLFTFSTLMVSLELKCVDKIWPSTTKRDCSGIQQQGCDQLFFRSPHCRHAIVDATATSSSSRASGSQYMRSRLTPERSSLLVFAVSLQNAGRIVSNSDGYRSVVLTLSWQSIIASVVQTIRRRSFLGEVKYSSTIFLVLPNPKKILTALYVNASRSEQITTPHGNFYLSGQYMSTSAEIG